jgi:dihydrofolate reductase
MGAVVITASPSVTAATTTTTALIMGSSSFNSNERSEANSADDKQTPIVSSVSTVTESNATSEEVFDKLILEKASKQVKKICVFHHLNVLSAKKIDDDIFWALRLDRILLYGAAENGCWHE